MSAEDNYLIKIQYIIKIPSVERVAPLTWPNQYDKRIIGASNLIYTIASMPINLAEMFCSKEDAIRYRMTGLFDGYQVDFVESFEQVGESPFLFKIIFTDEAPDPGDLDSSTIVVCCGDLSDVKQEYISLSNFSPNNLKERVLILMSSLDEPRRMKLIQFAEEMGNQKGYEKIKTDISASEGVYSRTMLAVLDSLRVNINRRQVTYDYVEKDIKTLVNVINHIRRKTADNSPHFPIPENDSYYIVDMSSNLDFSINKKNYSEKILADRGVEDPKSFISAIKHSDRGEASMGANNNSYICELEQERILLDGIIALTAAASCSPVIKIPLNNRDVYPWVRTLSEVDRVNGKKLNNMALQLRGKLSQHLDYWLEYFDRSRSSSIKLISNLPLEWTFHQGLPLMVRHEVSRIPVTPGYITSNLLLSNDNIHLSLQAFREILFISSFGEDDPIRNHLKNSIDIIQRMGTSIDVMGKYDEIRPRDLKIENDHIGLDVRIKWVEVSNKEELINAINSSNCAITVFDLHGSHGANGGVIHLRDEDVSVFEIYHNIRISPIVILSSCDTSPVDKGQNSTAEAFFLAGARTLISSALPIQSDLASTFLARLLQRITMYLPRRVGSGGQPIKWSTLVSGMTRRTYYYELITILQKKLKFDQSIKYKLLFDIGNHLDPLSPRWVELAKNEIINQLKVDEKYVEEFVLHNAQFFECMKYLQIGKPESIIISADGKY